jgi:hypothetical protein
MAIFKKAKDKVIDVASDIMSAPARFSAAKKTAKADRIFNDAKMVKDFKGAPDAGDASDPLFRARINNMHDVADAKRETQEKSIKLTIAKKVMAKPSDYGSDYAEMRSGKKIPYRNDMQRNGGAGYNALLKKSK